MADDIRLVISVEEKGILPAIQKTERLESSVRKLSKTYARNGVNYDKYRAGLNQLANQYGRTEEELRNYSNSLRASDRATAKAQKAAKDQARAVKELTQARREANVENQRFNAKAAADLAAQKATEQAVKKEKDARRALRMEFKEGYAAQVQYRAARMRLNQAEREGIITTQAAAVAQKNLGVQLQMGSKHMSRSGMITQQAGYQMGDFLVQVQGGQNWMVAFGQQATQMVGALYLLPSSMIAARHGIMGLTVSLGTLIAVAGILIPLITAIGAFWMKSRAELKKSKSDVNDLDKAIESLDQTLKKWVQTKRASSMGITVEELAGRDSIKVIEEEIARLDKVIDNAKKGRGLRGAGQGAMEDKQKGNLGKLDEARVRLGEVLSMQAEERVAAYKEERDALSASAEMQKTINMFGEDSAEVRAVALKQDIAAYESMIDAQVESNKLTEDAGELLKDHSRDILEQAALIEENNTKRERQLRIHDDMTAANREYNDFLNAQFLANEEITRELENQLEISKIIASEGENSIQIRYEEQEQARELKVLELQRLQLTGDMITKAMALYDEQVKITNEAETFAGIDLTSGISSATAEAGNLARSLSVALGVAVSIYEAFSMISKQESMISSGRGSGMEYTGIPDYENELGYKDVDTLIKEMTPKTPKGRSGKSEAKRIERMADAYGKLMDRLNGVDPLITKFNEEVSKLAEWQAAGAISMDQYSQAVAMLAKELEAAQDPLADFRTKLEDALDGGKNYAKAMESLNSALSDFLFNPFEDGVKGMVLQFSDALRRMASDAIAAAIMQKILPVPGSGGGGGGFLSGIGSFFQSIFMANGGVFSGGSQVTAYANGGIVNGPTMFPMANGAGLMGEAGPEAIMPLKRGSNGKLGVEVSTPAANAPQTEMSVKVINVDDRASIGKYLNSPAGEKVVLNVLRRNGIDR